MFRSLQRVPAHLSNGNIIGYQINYTVLGRTQREPTSLPAPGFTFNYNVSLRRNLVYSFVVDGKTEAGFNTSLEHKPIIISTMKNAGNVVFLLLLRLYLQY